MAEISITREDGPEGGRYVARHDGGESELTYRWRGDAEGDGRVMAADHTFTPPQARGQGIASKLVARAVADAAEAGFTIDPVCPYVAVWFDRHPEHAGRRA